MLDLSLIHISYERIRNTFVYLMKTEPSFAELLKESKGFCLPHFYDVLDSCREKLKPEEAQQMKEMPVSYTHLDVYKRQWKS